MNLVEKAYKCTFPNYFDCYDRNMWEDHRQYEVIYGDNQKQAVHKRCSEDENASYWEMAQHIRTRRFKDGDLYSQNKSELLKDLTDKQIHHLTHSLGVRIGDAFRGEFHRNYSFYYSKHERCEGLVKLGLMETWSKLGSQCYGVTEKGIEAVKTLLLINKNQ